MSKDIRSFFAAMSKKPAPAKKRSIPDDSDEDIVAETPDKKSKIETPQKKRKIAVINSDSEDESSKKQRPSSKDKKPNKQNVNLTDVFGSTPIKQSKVESKKTAAAKETKNGNKNDDFEKTLLDLDEDMFVENLDELDKTIDEAVSESSKNDKENVKVKKEVSTPKNTPKQKKKQEESDLDSTIDPDQERYEKKRHSAMLYQKFLNRGKPEHLGAKELPKGKPNCLQGLCFIKTGVLDSLEDADFQNLVKEHGGRTVAAVSKKVNYLVAGKDPGPSKMAKANDFGIKIISEDELLDLILVKSGEKPRYVKNDNKGDSGDEFENAPPKKEKKTSTKSEDKKEKTEVKNDKTEVKKDKTEVKKEKPIKIKEEKKSPVKVKEEKKSHVKVKEEKKSPTKNKLIEKVSVKKEKIDVSKVKKEHTKIEHSKDLPSFEKPVVAVATENMSWTEKYKPSDTKGIIGQQGPQSNMRKLQNWLSNWHKNHSGKNRPKLVKPSPWAKDDSGAYFKAALLSGPPGVGKTTTATLVAKELGFDVVEFNASDTRSKKLLHEEVAQLLSTTSLAGFFKDGSAPTKKHVLLMDEVDGMAGNEDRGGIQELINLIKNSNVPIICMCNDRNHQKMRSLVNYCFDLRFARPRMEQIRGAMMTVCCKEGVKINAQALAQIINSSGLDIRQVLNHLSIWSANDKNITEDVAEKESNKAKKDTIMGPWEVCRKVFSEEEHKSMSLADKSRLFFFDYSLAPLFVQENYLQVVPHCPNNEKLERVAKCADSLSLGDLVDTKIRKTNNWSLLESQAFYSSVLPGHYMEGHMAGQINFPGWLGKNSKRSKFQRLVCELQSHMRTSISGSRESVNLDYIYHIRDKIIKPLEKQGVNGVDEAINVMSTYNLTRDDFDSLLELTQWPGQKDPMRLVDSKVKAAFTRSYNKSVILPYAVAAAPVKKKAAAASADMDYGDEEEEDVSEEDKDDVSKDAMIKEKKKAPAKAKKEKDDPSTSNPKKGGRGKKAK